MSLPDIRGYFGNNVEEARDNILRDLCRLYHSYKVFYVDGWNGFGATAVLRSMATVVPSWKTSPELCFDRIFFIDCSEWKNRRAMQREITKELEFDSSVMAIFDKQDEEDDFGGVDQGSRNEILSVAAMIYQKLSSQRFMMFFLNGSDDEVDVTIFGIPQFTKFCNNKMIWTFSKRCLTMNNINDYSMVANKLGYTQLFLYDRIARLDAFQLRRLLSQEASTIVARVPCMLEIDPKMVEDCCLYDLFLYLNFHTTTKFSWLAHSSNYWICDAIIQGDISNALRREINWKCDACHLDDVLRMFKQQFGPLFLILKDDDVYEEGPYRRISITSRNAELHGMQTIPAVASSFFLVFERSDHPLTLPTGFFEHSCKLGVLVLCFCAFNFASPPFLKCHGLRFLGLDNCTHSKPHQTDNHTEWTCLYSLLVLDIRHTDWNEILSGEKIDVMTNIRELNIEGVRHWQYVAQLQGRLPNLQRLRIIRPTCPGATSNYDVDDSFIDKTSLEILDLSGNSYMKYLPTSLSKATSLQMLILDGCDGLENVVALGRLPLISFSFDGYGPASQRTPTVELPPKHFRPSTADDEKDISTCKISLEGCTELVNLFLRGLNNLVELDLSGTAIKILDFKTMVVQVPRLKQLFLIGCKHLRAIIFSVEQNNLELLCIDTRAGIVCPRPCINKTKSFRLQVHAVVVDARLNHSLRDLLEPYIHRDSVKEVYFDIHITSSPMYDGVVQFEETNKEKFDQCDQGNLQEQLISEGQYSDVLSMVGFPPMQAFPQPPVTRLDRHIEISKGSCFVESGLNATLGGLTNFLAESLHLHDLPDDITPVVVYEPVYLRQCHVERCPKLDAVFAPSSSWFLDFETFWASDLLMARWIWSKGSRPVDSYTYRFENLQHLHLHSCPRLQFVLPVWVSSFPSLETIHIIHCGDLVHVFELDGRYPEKIISLGVQFPKLSTIHLHDLPKLQQICEVKMVAPALETIRIRGCWALRRLPFVATRAQGAKKPTIEIEKDVWDALKWDAGHRPDHFESPVHSRYYKKKLPRVSVLM